MPKELIREGEAHIQVDTAAIVSKDLEVFYNPDMKLNRDITLDILKTHFDKPICMALPLAGSGVRAVRILKEIPQLVKNILINDSNPQATKLIKENLKRNNLQENDDVKVTESDASLAMENSVGFDYIDIDPFGSPNQFLDTAIRKLSRNGILAVTATDTAALAGTYPSTCKRKYWATSAVTPHKHESGIRILARKVMLLGIHHSKVLTPIFSYHDKHYYRIFFRCTKSREQASELLDSLQTYINYNKETAELSISDSPKGDFWSGPLYIGLLHDKEFLKKIDSEQKLFSQAITELDIVGSFDIHNIAEKHKISLPSFDLLMAALKEKGYESSRSMTNLHAIKTTASFQEVVETMKALENNIAIS